MLDATVTRCVVIPSRPSIRLSAFTGHKHKALFFNPVSSATSPVYPRLSQTTSSVPHPARSSASDFSVRFKWNAGDVAIWDNRTNIHSAIYEDVGVSRRHAIR